MAGAASNLDEKPWAGATLTQTFLFTDIEGSTAMMQRLCSCAIGCRPAWG